MYRNFPLFQSHIDLAHAYFARLIGPGDCVIDATCGNGHDTLLLARLLFENAMPGQLHAIDLQEKAILSTLNRLRENLSENALKQITLHHQSHADFPKEILPESVRLIVYNLGYLPGENKECTTKVESTLQSLENALPLLKVGGCISLTAYPGHPQGEEEERALMTFFQKLPPQLWNVCHHRFYNRKQAPSLFLIQRSL